MFKMDSVLICLWMLCVDVLPAELSNAIASAEKSLKFLEQTIVMVEANRSKFEHIDNVHTADDEQIFTCDGNILIVIVTDVAL